MIDYSSLHIRRNAHSTGTAFVRILTLRGCCLPGGGGGSEENLISPSHL